VTDLNNTRWKPEIKYQKNFDLVINVEAHNLEKKKLINIKI